MDAPTSTTGAPLPPPPPPRPAANRVTRSRNDRVIAGVCGGIAEHLRIDPVLVRIAVVVATFAGGAGLIAYAAAWLLLPEESEAGTAELPSRRRRGLTAIVLGLGLVLILSRVLWDRDGDLAFGALLVAGGALVLWRRREDTPGGPPPSRPGGTWAAQHPAPPPPPGTAGPSAGPSAGPAASPSTGTLVEVWSQPVASDAPPVPPPPVPLWSDATQAATHPAHDDGRAPLVLRVLGWIVVTAMACGVGFLRLLQWSRVTEGWPAWWSVVLAVAAAGGLAYVLVRHLPTGPVLAGMGAVAVSVLLVAATTDLRGSVGEWTRRPTTAGPQGFVVRHALGSTHLDLSDLVTTPGQAVPVTIDAGTGDIEIVVPVDATVVVDVGMQAGEIRLFGRATDGWDVEEQVTEAGPEGGPVVSITGQAGVGSLEVRRAAA